MFAGQCIYVVLPHYPILTLSNEILDRDSMQRYSLINHVVYAFCVSEGTHSGP